MASAGELARGHDNTGGMKLSIVRERDLSGKTEDMWVAATGLFESAVRRRASDIHIRVGQDGHTRIFFRIHNDLEFVEEHSIRYGDLLCAAIHQETTAASEQVFGNAPRSHAWVSGRALPSCLDGIRVTTSPQVGGNIMVLHLLYDDAGMGDLNDLGFEEEQINAIDFMKQRVTGLMVVAGPTGSGKSTTLQRVLGAVARESAGRKHIVTVESPPEYPIPGAVQILIADAADEETRQLGLRRSIAASMQLDPDIIMLSEIRDSEVARLALRAAQAGQPVWTTMRANNALGIIDRFGSLGVTIEELADPSTLGGLICQRLVKVLCPHCKKPLIEHLGKFNSRDAARVMAVLDLKNVHVSGDGCEHCNHTGTVGRTVVAETIVIDNQLMRLVRGSDRIGAIEYVRREQSSMSMLGHAIRKINAGLIDPFHAESVVGALHTHIIERDHRIFPEELK